MLGVAIVLGVTVVIMFAYYVGYYFGRINGHREGYRKARNDFLGTEEELDYEQWR